MLRRGVARALALGAAALALVLAVTWAVSSIVVPGNIETSPRQLTVEESERFALVRFLQFQAGGLTAKGEIPSADGPIPVTALLDFESGFGAAALTVADTPGLVQWSSDAIALWPDVGDGERVPAEAPETPATVRPLEASASNLDTVLAVLGQLASDRPENAQLLRQSGATWLRGDTVSGVPVDVFAGPGRDGAASSTSGGIRYWVDREGVLHRLELDLPAGTVSLDIKPGPVDLIRSPQLP